MAKMAGLCRPNASNGANFDYSVSRRLVLLRRRRDTKKEDESWTLKACVSQNPK